MSQPIEITEYTDAMCSWAWGTEPKLRLLRWRFESQIARWRVVMGHLVEDEYMPERDREAEGPKLQAYWKVVCDQTGMPRPDPLNRSTGGSRASGLVAKAAQDQGDETAQLILRRLREATFVAGEPPDTIDRALAAVQGVAGLDHEALATAAASEKTAAAYLTDGEETRTPNDHVLNLESDRPGVGRAREARDGRMRFVFPTIVVRAIDGSSERTVPGWMDYGDYEHALFDLGAVADDRATAHPTPAEALARWPSLAEAELAFLCGHRGAPPAEAVIDQRPGGTMILTKAEAEATGSRGLSED